MKKYFDFRSQNTVNTMKIVIDLKKVRGVSFDM